MAITTEQVKDLRDKTGVSIMQCRKALEEAGGDMDKAVIILRKKSGDLAAKRVDKTFGAGTVQAYLHATGTVGAMVVLVSETDFVSGNDEFKTLARDIAMHITAAKPKYLRATDITDAERAQVKEVLEAEMKKADAEAKSGGKAVGKPKTAEMQAKILDGKLAAYFGEMVLLNQPFIKNPEVTIQGLIDSAVQKFGEKIEIARFTRLAVSE
jgi:elongation factor Ts